MRPDANAISARYIGGTVALGVTLATLVVAGCKTHSNDDETRERARQEIAQYDKDNRDRELYRAEDLALVEKYESTGENESDNVADG